VWVEDAQDRVCRDSSVDRVAAIAKHPRTDFGCGSVWCGYYPLSHNPTNSEASP
jgi:hypothetical protein